jgi:hypothetical protein
MNLRERTKEVTRTSAGMVSEKERDIQKRSFASCELREAMCIDDGANMLVDTWTMNSVLTSEPGSEYISHAARSAQVISQTSGR